MLVAALCLAVCATDASAKQPPITKVTALAPLTLGFSAGADVALASGNVNTQAEWVPKAQTEGAQMVRLDVDWNQVAPKKLPSGFDATNPGDPNYKWTQVDEQVRELAAAHFQIMITIQFAPSWAEGPNMPKTAGAGTWEPNPSDLSAFAQAIATRYDGSYADPLNTGKSLPRVSIWQAWDEPNLPTYLNPQWSYSSSGGYQPVSPNLYRTMENDFYATVKGVSKSNYVVLAGLGPYGDDPGTDPTDRMRPVEFERELLCVTPTMQQEAGCAGRTDFDAIDSHPYGIYGPNWHAYFADDVSIPDIYKLANVLHAAEKFGAAAPRGAKGDWVTETSWDTDPPDPDGEPIATQAKWLEQAIFNLWKQGVSTVLWWQIEDSPPIPNYASTYQAGTYYLNGQAKPSAESFRLPFVTFRKNYKTVIAWSHVPYAGVVSIQAKVGSGWRTLARVRVKADEVFEVPLHLILKQTLREKIGAYVSLPWVQSG
jgi:hypothetical protein